MSGVHFSCHIIPLLVYDVGDRLVLEDIELQRQVVRALNSVLYEQLNYKGNEFDYYNPLNSYIHQVGLITSFVYFTSQT